MSRRNTHIVTGETYHIFNRSIAGQPIFGSIWDRQRLLDTLNYYHYSSLDIRFSFYNRLPIEYKLKYLEEIKVTKTPLVEIYAFCLMPNHFHILAKELIENGIRKFIGNLENSYAKYFNKKKRRSGSLFQEMFKVAHIDSDEQFVHVSRYIHLNPKTSHIVTDFEQLINYSWSSLPIYLERAKLDFLKTNFLLSFYKNNEELKNFTFDQADYQKTIHDLEYLTLEKY